MRHVRLVSRKPARAQDLGVCSQPESDFQVQMCVLLQILTAFILPLSQLKSGFDPET